MNRNKLNKVLRDMEMDATLYELTAQREKDRRTSNALYLSASTIKFYIKEINKAKRATS